MTTAPIPERITEEKRIPMSYEEYVAWDTDGKLVEWVDGEAIVHMPPTTKHQLIVLFLERLFSLHVNMQQLGTVLLPPFEVKLGPEQPSREPDILFVAAENLDRLHAKRLEGPPDLIVEVISPGSVTRDRDEKFREYEAAGVPEYWIVDSRPGHHRTDFYRLDEGGRYTLFATEDEERVASYVLPSFWIRPTWLWRDPLPDPLLALAQIMGADVLIDHVRTASDDADF